MKTIHSGFRPTMQTLNTRAPMLHLCNLDVVADESLFAGLFSFYYPEPSPLLVGT
ncbi:MAG TPA: hypothetical protein VES20_09605 [Bryobacteraceae bacterium]|nr:hypothetical protein [Bryobacteraceae bacterium]